MKLITFEKSARKNIFDFLGKTTDQDGYLVEKNDPHQRVLTQEGEEIHESQFGGVRKGSEIFFKSDIVSLINLYDALNS
jgi:hypothetical protein